MFFNTPGNGGLEKETPDQTIYLGFDIRYKEHAQFFHKEFYNHSAMKRLQDSENKPKRAFMNFVPETPQINNISFDVSNLTTHLIVLIFYFNRNIRNIVIDILNKY